MDQSKLTVHAVAHAAELEAIRGRPVNLNNNHRTLNTSPQTTIRRQGKAFKVYNFY